MQHVMSATAVGILIMLALTIDYLSVGPDNFRDKIAFTAYLAAIYEGFNGSDIDRWTVQRLGMLLDGAKHAAGNAYVAGANTHQLIGSAVGCLAIYTVGCLIPQRWSKKVGYLAKFKFPTSPVKRINYKLLICAILLGLLSDLTKGTVGTAVAWLIHGDVWMWSFIPSWLFG